MMLLLALVQGGLGGGCNEPKRKPPVVTAPRMPLYTLVHYCCNRTTTPSVWPPSEAARLLPSPTASPSISHTALNGYERVFLEPNNSIRRQSNDYGYDLSVLTCDEKGLIEPGSLLIQ